MGKTGGSNFIRERKLSVNVEGANGAYVKLGSVSMSITYAWIDCLYVLFRLYFISDTGSILLKYVDLNWCMDG